MIDLSSQWKYIEQIASERLQNNKTSRHVSVFGEEIEVLGAAGELAARQYFGLPADLGVHFDGGTDFILFGMRIDVKATVWTKKLQFRYLQWPLWKPIKSDVILYTAVNPAKKRALIIGYATRSEMAMANINTTRYDPCHEISVNQLHPVSSLMKPSPKPGRIHDPAFSKTIIGRDGVCLYGLRKRQRCSGGLDAHHIKTKGSGGDDCPENGITLCRQHHGLAQTNVIKPDELRTILSEYYGYEYQVPGLVSGG